MCAFGVVGDSRYFLRLGLENSGMTGRSGVRGLDNKSKIIFLSKKINMIPHLNINPTSVLKLAFFVLLYLLPFVVYANGYTFIENKGQFDLHVHYKIDLNNGAIFFENNQWTFNFVERMHSHAHGLVEEHLVDHEQDLKAHAFQMKFVDANQRPSFQTGKALDTYYNYFLGNDPAKWAGNVALYKELTYSDLYKGIDMKVYEKDRRLKYDFIVRANQDPSKIKIAYEGVESIAIRSEDLVIKTSVNQITELHPYAYQIIKGERRTVDCAFVLNENQLQFKFPNGWNADYELIIDPELIFSSYSGSSGDNWGYTATYDEEGNLYSGSIVFETGYPIVNGSYDIAFNGGDCDIAISKFNSTGTDLIYSTFIGGSNTEMPQSLIVNSEGELIVFGSTGSSDYPITSQAYDKNFEGGPTTTLGSNLGFSNGSDIILTVLNQGGNALIGSTYFGGSDLDGLNFTLYESAGDSPFTGLLINYGDQSRGEVIVDENDNIYFASTTFSSDISGTPTLQSNNNGLADGLIAKFSPDVSDVDWFSYLGGSKNDAAYSIKINKKTKDIYICGGTQSTDFPNTTGMHAAYRGGRSDGFIVGISSDGTSSIAGTYIGTDKYDQCYLIDTDTSGYVYAFGQTVGDFPITEDIYNNPGGSQFIQKLNSELRASLFSTVFGNGESEINISPSAFTVGEDEKIYLTGWGGKTNENLELSFIGDTRNMDITSDAFQTSTDGSDFYFATFSKDAKDLLYATYFGSNGTSANNAGEHVHGNNRIDKNGVLYQAVCAGCYGIDDFPTTPGAWSNDNGTSQKCNLAVVKLNLNSDKEVGIVNSTTSQSIKIYPNPNDGQFMIETLDNNSLSTIKIFNSIGQVVFEKDEINAPIFVNLKEQGSGVYLISVETSGGVVVEKVVLNR